MISNFTEQDNIFNPDDLCLGRGIDVISGKRASQVLIKTRESILLCFE